MGTYKIQIHGQTLHVRVADCAALAVTGLAELIPHIQTTKPVGLAFKFHNNGHNNKPLKPISMLQLCVGTRCLVILLYRLDHIPHTLKDFLADQEICFVGVVVTKELCAIGKYYGIECKSSVEVSELGARILRKPKLCGSGLVVLANKVGIDLEESPDLASFNWGGEVFSDKEIKYAVRDVYASYLIGSKQLGSLFGLHYRISKFSLFNISFFGYLFSLIRK